MWLVHDAGPEAGMGHERRTAAIAEALARRGAAASIVASGSPVRGGLLFVDSYTSRADDATRYSGDRIVAIDDLERDLAVDLLVEPGSDPAAVASRRARAVLAGVDFAPLDPSLGDVLRRPIGPVRRVLVTTGAADRSGTGTAIAAAVAELAGEVVLVVGPWGSEVVPDGVVAVRAAGGLNEELGRADLVVTAAGVTMLESLALGRPTIGIVTAGNQAPSAARAAAAGAALVVDDVPAAVAAVHRLVADGAARTALAEAASSYVDGQGADRIAEAMLALV